MSPVARPLTSRDRRGDLVLAGVLLIGGILSTALSSISEIYGDEQGSIAWALVYVAIVTLPLAFRRKWPALIAILVSVAYFVAVTFRLPELYVGNIAVFIALYTVGAWMGNRRTAMIVRVAIIVGMFIWLVTNIYRQTVEYAAEADVATGAMSPYLAFTLLQVLLNMLYFGGAYYFGERAWNAAVQRSALEQRTADLEHERELTAAQAVALDRVRIARELHDVVAHHVSVMGVQAGAARVVLDTNPEQAKDMMQGVEGSAREAITELRHLLETLRTSADDSLHAPSTVTLDSIEDLIESSIAAGVPTTYTIVGDPTVVSPFIAVNLYRIAQESLTNARRHGGVGTTADVRVRYGEDTVELEVTNTGRMASASRTGLGQLGMRERALASGGTIESAPRERGGWRVRARVPVSTVAELHLDEAPATPTPTSSTPLTESAR